MDTDDLGKFSMLSRQGCRTGAGIRIQFAVFLLLPVMFVMLGVGYLRAKKELNSVQSRLLAEIDVAEQAHDEAVSYERQERRAFVREQEAAHRIRLANKRLFSGELAYQVHLEEWKRRLAQDPALAASPMESTMLKMKRVGADSAVDAAEAIKQVAAMASPPGSRIEVSPIGSGFGIRMAFNLSAVVFDEVGGVTRHRSMASMRREIESVSSRLIRQLLVYCGSRGIQRVSVSCNRAVTETPVPANASAEDREALRDTGELVMRSVYRISVAGSAINQVADWAGLPEASVLRLANVEKDSLSTARISGKARRGSSADPVMPLEF